MHLETTTQVWMWTMCPYAWPYARVNLPHMLRPQHTWSCTIHLIILFTCRLYTDVSSRLVVLYLLLWSANVPLAQSAKLGEPSTRNESIQDFIIMVSVYCTCRQTSDKSSIHESMTSGFSHIMAEPCNESIPIKCRDLTWLYSAPQSKNAVCVV